MVYTAQTSSIYSVFACPQCAASNAVDEDDDVGDSFDGLIVLIDVTEWTEISRENAR